MGVQHSDLWRNVRLRFERDAESRCVDVFVPGRPEPITVGIGDFKRAVADATAVVRQFDAEETCRNAGNGVIVAPLRVVDGDAH